MIDSIIYVIVESFYMYAVIFTNYWVYYRNKPTNWDVSFWDSVYTNYQT